jgi:hypothetical protein
VLEQIWHLAELTRAEILAGIGLQDRETFIGVLERIHANLCALEGQPLPAGELGAAEPVAPMAAASATSRRNGDVRNLRNSRKARAP